MKRPPLVWDEAARHHDAVIAGLARCQCPGCNFCALRDQYGRFVKVEDPDTGDLVLVPHRVRVPHPVGGDRCLYCRRSGEKRGALPVSPWPLPEDSLDVDAEGGLATEG